MRADPPTRPSLLVRIRNPQDHEAWSQFEEVYRALVIDFALSRQLQAADAQDIWQEVLLALHRNRDHFTYDPSRSFASWLRTVTLNKIRDRSRRAKRQVAGTGRSSVQQLLEHQ